MLERAAWARLQPRAYAPELERWTLGYLGGLNRSKQFDGQLRSLVQGYVPSQNVARQREELTKLVRDWAQQVLEDQ